MRSTQLLGLLLLTGFLSGCVFWHTADPPEIFSNTDLLESLIGQKSESVIRKLGLPNEFLLDGDKQFMIYFAFTSWTRHGLMLDPYGPYQSSEGEGAALYCLRIQLDSDGFVVKYPLVKSRTSHPIKNCRNVFWSKEELLDLEVITDFSPAWKEVVRKSEAERAEREAEREAQKARKQKQQTEKLKQKAEQGNAEAQLALFKNLRVKNPNEALAWLCRSADSGNKEARMNLGYIYEYGGYRDYKLAYIWYSLSSDRLDEEDMKIFADRYLTPNQYLDVQKELKEWKSGNCERDLRLMQGD